jgi:hypothetical protein
MTMWDPTKVTLESSFISQHWLLTIFKSVQMDLRIFVINLYMSVAYQEKLDCWRTLSTLKPSLNLSSSIIAGYFNTVLRSNEKRGGNHVCDSQREHMEDLISYWDLMDIKLGKGKYTWSNKRS